MVGWDATQREGHIARRPGDRVTLLARWDAETFAVATQQDEPDASRRLDFEGTAVTDQNSTTAAEKVASEMQLSVPVMLWRYGLQAVVSGQQTVAQMEIS